MDDNTVVPGIVGPYPYSIQPHGSYSDSESPAPEVMDIAAAYENDKAQAEYQRWVRGENDAFVEAMESEEVRITATSGGQKGSKPTRYDLIPTDALELLARHYGKGNAKYPAVNGIDNWRNGYPWSLSYAAMQRHLNQFWAGEDYDEETGSLHLVAAMWHCATLIHFVNHPDMDEEYDDRQDVLDGSRHR